MRNKIFQSQLDKMPFVLSKTAMSALLEVANSNTDRLEATTPSVANNSVVYEKINNIGIISVDGGMYKKDIGGLCSSVASYDKIVKAIDQAENDDEVKTIIFRVDSPGGAVAGIDEVESKIYSSKKQTITLYENVGASGAIWAFTASKELYATEGTMLGSIGVVVSYMETEDDEKRIEIVSKNAENKRCSINGNCKEKIENMINVYEDMFFARVEKNTGFTADKIKKVFNNGDMIFAKQAKEAGFIKEITTFASLLSSLNINKTEANPTASGDNSKIKTTGADMVFDRENLDATEATFKALVLNRDTLTGRINSLEMSLQTTNAALATKNEDMEALKADMEAKVTEAEGKFASLQTEMQTRMAEAIATGVDMKVASEMLQAKTAEEASKIALDAKKSDGGTHQGEDHSKPSGLLAYATKHKGTLK